MRIYHNIPALTAYNALNHTSNALQKTIQKLSTGLRINSASDDAAGLAISEKMRAQISGLEMAQRNAQDGISMLQTAEGAIQSTQSILQRMRELAVQASNDTLTAEDRSYIQLEVGELKNEVERIAHTTQFNGKRLLDGSSAGVVSSSNLNVKAYVRGSLREIDQFGQKKSFEGNYKIQIKASGAGQGEAQKSAIMVIKHPNVITDVNVNVAAGVEKVSVDNVPAGNYTVKTVASTTYEAALGTGNFTGISLDGGTTVTGRTITGGTEIKGYALNATGEPVFDSVGERSMTIRAWKNDGTYKDFQFEVKKDYTQGGTIDEGTALKALVKDLNDYGDGTAAISVESGYNFSAALNPSTGKIELTVSHATGSDDAVRVELVEQTTAAPDERTGIDYIMGKNTPVDPTSNNPTTTEVLTGKPYTAWNSGDAALKISLNDVLDGTNPNKNADFTIPATEAGTIDELVDEMNKKIGESALRGLVKAEKVGDSALRLVSTRGTIKVEEGSNHTAKAEDGATEVKWYDAFGFSSTDDDNISKGTLTGGTTPTNFNFLDEENSLKGASFTVTVGTGTAQKITLENKITDIDELITELDSKLNALGVDAVKIDLGNGKKGVQLVSDQSIKLEDGGVSAAEGTVDAIKRIFGYTTTVTAGVYEQTTSNKNLSYEDVLPMLSATYTKTMGLKYGNPAVTKNITLAQPFANVQELADYLNAKELTNTGVLAKVENGALKLVADSGNTNFELVAPVVVPPATVAPADGRSFIMGGATTADSTTPGNADYTDLLSLISENNKKILKLKDESNNELKTVTLTKSIKTVDDLVTELNNQLADTGVVAKNNNGTVKLVSGSNFSIDTTGVANPNTNDWKTILGITTAPTAAPATLSFEESLATISAANPKTLTVTPLDADGNAVAANAITVPVTTPQNSVGDLINYLNAQTSLTDAGYTAVDDGKGGVKLTSTTSANGFSVSGTLLGDASSGDKGATLQKIESAATLTGNYGLTMADGKSFGDYLTASVDDSTLVNNASILFEVSAVNPDNGTVTLKATSNVLATDGTVKNYVMDNIVLSTGDAAALDLGGKLGLAGLDENGAYKANAFTLKLTDTSAFQSGAKFVFNINKKVDGENARTVQISGTQDPDWPDSWGEEPKDASGKVTGAPLTDAEVRFGIDASQTTSKDLHFRNFYVNSDNGKVYEGDVVLTTGKEVLKDDTALATFTAAYIGKTATADTKLRDLSAFWNSQGVFMLESPQTITITQGDGKTTSITLYATDTLDDMRQKLNSAIGTGLGQAQYATGDTDKFCTFVEKKPGVDMPANGLETVAGTFIFRSLVPGAAGRLTFSGDQDVINAFSMNVVTEPQESSFTASIYDAHTGQAIATNVKVTDNNLIGILHPNVDIEFDPMANITAVWSESQKNFITTSESKPYEAVIHLVDSSTVYQVGANKGEDLALDIGDMTAGSLGITKVNVATREAASRAIGQLDAAINKVSAQRAKIGAYQNSLEYTIENLQTTATNLTAAESRIRDADMAKTMMEFVKLQILNQSGTSMLAQANQLPQQVLSLLQ